MMEQSRRDDMLEQYGVQQKWGANDSEAGDDFTRAPTGEGFFRQSELDPRETKSEMEYYAPEVRRSNYVSLFSGAYGADAYVATNLYGAMEHLKDTDASFDDQLLSVFESAATTGLNTTFERRAAKVEKQVEQTRKLSYFETYIALIKGYCAIAILMLPKSFANGGYGVSPLFIAGNAVVSTVCVAKLIDAGNHFKLYSYSLVVEKALGKRGRFVLDVMIALTQLSFTISHITFLVSSFKTTVDTLSGADTNVWIYGAIVIMIYSPIAWVRNIAKFSFTFMLGNLLIVMGVTFVTVYCFMTMARQGGLGEGLQFVNPDSYLNTLGYSVYCFEGIGIVMPVMQSSAEPAQFKSALIAAITTLTVVYIAFGEIGYLTWGSGIDQALATEMLPP